MAPPGSRKFVKRKQTSLPPIESSQEHIHTVEKSSIQTDAEDDDASINEVSYLASCNWLARGEQTILIPGAATHPTHSDRS